MQKRTLPALMPLLLLINGCGGGAASEEAKPATAIEPPSADPVYALPADEDIAAKIYNPDYSVPDGFFVDERASSASSYTIYHVMDESGSYERCTDSFATAESWEEADNATRAVQGYYVGAYENDRYFEFIRELAYDNDVGNVGTPTSPGYARIFKCANTNRNGVDRSVLNGYAGRLNATPRSAADVQVFAEYLWQFTFFPYRHKKVLDSLAHHTAGSYERTLVLAFAINQGTGRCDRIEVVNWAFSADRVSGDVTQSFDVVHTFEARLDSGSPVVCQ